TTAAHFSHSPSHAISILLLDSISPTTIICLQPLKLGGSLPFHQRYLLQEIIVISLLAGNHTNKLSESTSIIPPFRYLLHGGAKGILWLCCSPPRRLHLSPPQLWRSPTLPRDANNILYLSVLLSPLLSPSFSCCGKPPVQEGFDDLSRPPIFDPSRREARATLIVSRTEVQACKCLISNDICLQHTIRGGSIIVIYVVIIASLISSSDDCLRDGALRC
ncbi:hypothetical protein GOP47_0023299, partial [Adiantum capillus-veneris]